MLSRVIDWLLGTSKIHRAARQGDYGAVVKLLSNGANINQKARNGSTALNLALLKGHIYLAKHLISKGANVNIKDSLNILPLNIAVLQDDVELVKLLLDAGADPKLYDSEAFVSAALLGRLDIVDLMIERGIDVNAKCEGGTALHGAIANGHIGVVNALLNAGANIDEKEDNGLQTPLHFALSPENTHENIANILISRGANVNAKSKYGTTPLILVVCNPNHMSIVSTLIAYGADVNIVDNNGRSPLYWARANASGCNDSIVNYLIKNGAR